MFFTCIIRVAINKGLFHLKPPMPRYTYIWDVRLVLSLLRSWSPLSSLSLVKVTLKLCMLIALLTAPRAQTLKALDIEHMAIIGSNISFHITGLLKTSKQGKKVGQEVHMSSYPPDRRLCVLRVLRHYLERTENIRNSHTQLFISYKHPHEPVSTDTLARWIREVLMLVGIDTKIFMAHSVRSASVSAAKRAFIPTKEILQRANWSSEKTFSTFYDKPVTSASNYQSAILSLK
jgi:integrase